ncbi:PadR family transcriptional regulator [Virgisporangium aurantiacum]|uniref:PadR family transcriptional regulator n=1 Tax=Virgisporangium aurantiacum TaxID=175570 RepID=UPI00195052A1|nr:helix-turn-helix transcriptional regulator [Virgisporangium aurantiacum]
MTRSRRPSAQTLLVVRALAVQPDTWRYGYELGLEIGLRAGSLYPILIRLCDRGLLEAAWESDPPPNRPPRHLYRLTGDGVRWIAAVTAAPAPRAATELRTLREAW